MKAYDDDDFFINDRDEDDDTLDSLIDEEYNTFNPSEFDAEDDDAQWYDDEDEDEDLESQGYSIEDDDDFYDEMKKISIRTNLTRFST